MTRRGFSLVEILVAIAIVVGPLIAVITSVQASSRASRFNASHLGLEMLVTDLIEQLCTEAAARLADLSKAEGQELLAELIDNRIDALEQPAAQEAARKDARNLRAVELAITRAGGNEHPRLYRVEVQARSMLGGVVRAVRLVQVPPRVPPRP